MKIELCVPAYNEAPIIAEALRTIRAGLPALPDVVWHITLVDNGSTDGTAAVAEELGLPDVSVRTIATRGKGAAVVAAARASDADIFGFIDADLSADPLCIPALIEALDRGSDIAIGSRLLKGATVHRTGLRTFSSELFNWIRRLLLGITVVDILCGLKVTNRRGRDLLAQCMERGWFFDVEWLARAQRQGLTIAEVPIVWVEKHFPDRKSKLSMVRDGLGSIVAFVRIRYRLTVRAYTPRSGPR